MGIKYSSIMCLVNIFCPIQNCHAMFALVTVARPERNSLRAGRLLLRNCPVLLFPHSPSTRLVRSQERRGEVVAVLYCSPAVPARLAQLHHGHRWLGDSTDWLIVCLFTKSLTLSQHISPTRYRPPASAMTAS